MSFWSGFTDKLTAIRNGIGSQLSKGAADISKLTTETAQDFASSPAGQTIVNKAKEFTAPRSEQELNMLLKDAATMNKPWAPVAVINQKSNDLLLKAATEVNNRVLQPAFKTAVTATLLSDLNSPLYVDNKYKPGFQPSDIKDAWERSKKVSIGQALTKSSLIPMVGSLSGAVLKLGKIDVNEVNLYNDKNIKENYVDNIVGKWFTGGVDLVAGNAVAGGVFKGFAVAGKYAGKSAGIYTKEKTITQWADDVEQGILHAQTNGAQGKFTNSAKDMIDVAESTDYDVITNIVNKYTTNQRLIPRLHTVKDPKIALDIFAADKGDIRAMERLANTDPDILFGISDTASQLRSIQATTGNVFLPEGPAVPRLKAAFDKAIERDPRMVELRKDFMDDSYSLTPQGRDYFPMEPKYGAKVLGKVAETLFNTKNALKYREFTGLNDIMETTLKGPGGELTTRLVKFSTTTGARGVAYKPLGNVTFSSLRPLDARVELNAFIDSLPLFRDGSRMLEKEPGVYIKAADLRKEFEADLINAGPGQNELAILEKIDKQIGHSFAYSMGLYKPKEVEAVLKNLLGHVTKNKDALTKNGYAVDHAGNIIEAGAQTIRQMRESYRFMPHDKMQKQFLRELDKSQWKTYYRNTADFLEGFYNDLQAVWTFDALARPMFITKQSLFEPMVSTTLAHGIDEVVSHIPSTISNIYENNINRIMSGLTKVYNTKELKSISKTITHKRTMLGKAIAIKDMKQAEYEAIIAGKSAAIREQHLSQVKSELNDASKLVDDMELDLLEAVVPLGAKEAIPSMSLLERRIAFIEKTATGIQKAKIASQLANAKAAIGQYKGTINSLAINRKAIQDAENALTAAYTDIDSIVKSYGEDLTKQADVFGKSAAYKERYYGKKDNYRVIDGQYVRLDYMFEKNQFGRAIGAEVDNAMTSEQNYLGELSVGSRKALISRKIPNNPISIDNPIYFEELAHVANDLMRKDPLFDLIFADKTPDELYKWAISTEGVNYLEHFGIVAEDQIRPYLQEKVALVNRTFPSKVSRATILEREITSQELQSQLMPYVDRLFDIAPSDFYYDRTVFTGSTNWLGDFDNLWKNTSAKVFRALTKPENPIRRMHFNEVALDEVARQANILTSQGVKMTVGRYNALKLGAEKIALENTEKTFYTSRRQLRGLYNARAFFSFPTATLNAFARYGRLAIKNPERVAGFMYNYGRTFRTFGVDQYGNHTTNIDEITHIIIPGTDDLGFNKGEGVLISGKSIGFFLNMFSPSFLGSIAVGQVMKYFPETQDDFKKVFGPLWDIWFPYGPPDSVGKSLTPPWANALYNGIAGPEGKKDFMDSWGSVYSYHRNLADFGIAPMPSDDQIRRETKALWRTKSFWSWGSFYGVPVKVDTTPNNLIDSVYGMYLKKHISEGKSFEEAKTLAGDDMIATVGTRFMTDNVTFSGSNKNLSINPTTENWNRVFKDNPDLVALLADVDSNNLNFVALLGADLEQKDSDFNTAIYRKLNDPKLQLPKTNKLVNNPLLTPMEEEKQRLGNRAWTKYSDLKKYMTEEILALRPDGADKSINAVLQKEERKQLSTKLETAARGPLRAISESFYNEWLAQQSGDSAAQYANALTKITRDKKFMSARGNSKFWTDVDKFISQRAIAAMVYGLLQDGDFRKADILDAYQKGMMEKAKTYHPKLQAMIEKYFENDKLKAVL